MRVRVRVRVCVWHLSKTDTFTVEGEKVRLRPVGWETRGSPTPLLKTLKLTPIAETSQFLTETCIDLNTVEQTPFNFRSPPRTPGGLGELKAGLSVPTPGGVLTSLLPAAFSLLRGDFLFGQHPPATFRFGDFEDLEKWKKLSNS